jgi:cytochrome c556
VPFDGALAAANAEVLSQLSLLPFAGFVEGTSGTKKGDAKANVWTERVKFDAATKKMQDEAMKLVIAAKSNNFDAFKAAVGATGGACSSCHDDFRNP